VADVLRQLADRSAAQPSVAAGLYDYVHIRSWERPLLPNGRRDLGAAEQQVDSESWRNPSAGWQTVHTDGELTSDGEVNPMGPGGIDMPTEPDALEEKLLNPGGPRPLALSLCFSMFTRVTQQAVEPQVLAAFLRLLATKDEVRLLGQVVDRLGRPGIAVEVPEIYAAFPPRPDVISSFVHTIVLDPTTGGVLSWEPVLVDGGDPVMYPDPRPTSLGVRTLVETGRVNSIGQRPSGS
jgi:hypothetical protein